MATPAKEPKVGLLIGLGAAKPKAGEKEEPSESGTEDDERKRMAGKALRDALSGDDDMAVYDAFKELMDCCDEMGMGGEEEETETEEG